MTTKLGSFTLQKTAKDEAKGNWVTDGVKATVGEISKVSTTCCASAGTHDFDPQVITIIMFAESERSHGVSEDAWQ